MTELNEVYKCEVCGNIVEVLHTGAGQLVCCGKEMVKQTEKSVDEGKEKHVPIVEKTDNGIKVKVGEVEHPMTEEHHIEWIEVLTKEGTQKVFLKPGEKPEAEFNVTGYLEVRSYCNLHGLWKS
ncbi:desulfoferrodoxin [Candidatus Woesearchaeota archaeon]|nr:MAG: desulfoferrodoxin [Candidatus Woesearchaeota archaeon]